MLKKVVQWIKDGKIYLGMTRQDLKNLMGEPHYLGGITRKYKRAMIWKYDTIEFTWHENSLCLVMEVIIDTDYHETLLKG